jgi:hypothetical protein
MDLEILSTELPVNAAFEKLNLIINARQTCLFPSSVHHVHYETWSRVS